MPTNRKEYAQAHYAANKSAYIARSAVQKKAQNLRLTAIAREEKSRPCMDCGVEYSPWVMQFDHVRGLKRDAVAVLATRGGSEARFREEIAKCDVVCANCHAERTYQRRHCADDVEESRRV